MCDHWAWNRTHSFPCSPSYTIFRPMTGTYSYKVMRHIRRKNSWLEKTFGIRIVLGADRTSKQSKIQPRVIYWPARASSSFLSLSNDGSSLRPYISRCLVMSRSHLPRGIHSYWPGYSWLTPHLKFPSTRVEKVHNIFFFPHTFVINAVGYTICRLCNAVFFRFRHTVQN